MASKTIVITGTSSGLGAAVAAQALAAGHAVIGLDVQPGTDPAIDHRCCDLADPAAIDAVVANLPAQIDALVHCAAVPGPMPAELVIKVNVLGLRHLTDALHPRIVRGGAVVAIASTAGREWLRRAELVNGLLDTPDFASGLGWAEANRERWAKDPYTFSKQCVVALVLRSAQRFLSTGVRTNVVSPGGIATAMSPAFRELMGAEQFDWMNAQTGRSASPSEIAEVVAFAAFGQCSWLNGADLVVDGGFTAGVATGWIDMAQSPFARARAARAG